MTLSGTRKTLYSVARTSSGTCLPPLALPPSRTNARAGVRLHPEMASLRQAATLTVDTAKPARPSPHSRGAAGSNRPFCDFCHALHHVTSVTLCIISTLTHSMSMHSINIPPPGMAWCERKRARSREDYGEGTDVLRLDDAHAGKVDAARSLEDEEADESQDAAARHQRGQRQAERRHLLRAQSASVPMRTCLLP